MGNKKKVFLFLTLMVGPLGCCFDGAAVVVPAHDDVGHLQHNKEKGNTRKQAGRGKGNN